MNEPPEPVIGPTPQPDEQAGEAVRRPALFRVPYRRRRELRPAIPVPVPEELAAIPPDRRLELEEQRRQGRHQRINSIGILIGALVAAASLITTAETLRAGQEQLTIAREGQVTERYTKAVEQLGSTRPEVRAAAAYALRRIARDSPRDVDAIREVLAAFVRQNDPGPGVRDEDLPDEPSIDVTAALTALGATLPLRPADVSHPPRYTPSRARILWTNSSPLDLHGIRVPGAQLRGIRLPEMVDLSGANLRGADLQAAGLQCTHQREPCADLSGADLSGANLRGAYLPYADLSGADLSGADVSGADLRGADLRGAKGLPDDIRQIARVDESTRF